MKTEFILQLFDDEQTAKKMSILNRLEIMFDDHRNALPDSYFQMVENLPLGCKVKVTFEIVND